MNKKSLIHTNPYLKDPAKRRAMFCATVSSSTAIEGVHAPVIKAIKALGKSRKIMTSRKPEASDQPRR